MSDLKRPLRVRLHDEFQRDKLNIGERDWMVKGGSHPRNGLVYRGREYVVEGADYLVKHFIDGGDLVVVEGENEDVVTFEDYVENLPYLTDAQAEQVLSDYSSKEDLVEGLDAEYLTALDGVGASRAEKILEAVKGENQ